MSLSISIAIHNPDVKMFEEMLQSLIEYAADMTQLLIFDNDSSDYARYFDLVQEISKLRSGIHVDYYHSTVNVGFGEAHNENLKRATKTYFAVINDDVLFKEDWSNKMIEILRTDSDVAQVGMKRGTCNMLNVYAEGMIQDTDNPDYIEASCVMMRTRDAVAYGLFDTATFQFAYFEDTDLSLRLKKEGRKLATIDVDWIHYRAQTKTDIDVQGYHARNAHAFKQRYTSYLLKKRFGPCIVVRRTGSIGDVFLTLPILRALKQNNADATIVLATSHTHAVELSTYHDAIITQPFAPIACDLFIDLDAAYERDFRRNIVDAYAAAAGVAVERRREAITVSASTMQKIQKIVADRKNIVALDLSSTWAEKQLSYETYQQIAERLQQDGYEVALIGKNDYRKKQYIKCDIDLVNQLNVIETGCFLSFAKCYIGHEGLDAHLAQASDVRSVIVYGCTLPQYTNDITSTTLFPVISEVACVGCRHVKNAGNMVICPRNAECMKRFTADQLYSKFQAAMK